MRRCLFCRLICEGPTQLITCASAISGTLLSVCDAPTLEFVPIGLLPVRMPLPPPLPPLDPVTLVTGPFEPPGVRLPAADELPPPDDGMSESDAIESNDRRWSGGAWTMIGYCTPLI